MLLFADSFDIYATFTSNMTDGVYASAGGSLAADPDGVSTQRVWQAQGNTSIRYVLTADEAGRAAIGVARRVYLSSLPANTGQRPRIITVRNDYNQQLCAVKVETTGALSIVDDNDTLVAATSGPVITAEGWWHVEAAFETGTLSPTVTIRVEGVEVLTATFAYYSFDAGDVSPVNHVLAAQIALEGKADNIGAAVQVSAKDFVVWNTQGTENNDWLGGVMVVNLRPDGDDALNWTPSTGAVGWSILDNDPATSPYISAGNSPIPDPAVFTMQNLPVDVSSVKGVFTFVRAGKSDGGDGNLQASLVSGVTAVTGVDRPIPSGQIFHIDGFEVDPATSAAWTPAAVDAVKLRLDRTL